MSEHIEVNDKEYELEGNPSLGTVREVQSMQMDIIRDYVSEERLKQMDSLEDEGALIDAIIEEGGYDSLQDVMWERSMLETIQTISLAADRPFGPSDFDDMRADQFKEAREDSEDALNGDASDFFNGLGIGLSLNSEKMEQRASQMRNNGT